MSDEPNSSELPENFLDIALDSVPTTSIFLDTPEKIIKAWEDAAEILKKRGEEVKKSRQRTTRGKQDLE